MTGQNDAIWTLYIADLLSIHSLKNKVSKKLLAKTALETLSLHQKQNK